MFYTDLYYLFLFQCKITKLTIGLQNDKYALHSHRISYLCKIFRLTIHQTLLGINRYNFQENSCSDLLDRNPGRYTHQYLNKRIIS